MACARTQAWALFVALATLTLSPSSGQDFQQTPVLGRGPPASCYKGTGIPQRCIPEFENAAFEVLMEANNTCGDNGDIRYCIQTGMSTRKSCEVCTPGRFQPYFLTDLHHEHENQTWWQSETMNEGIQYPNQVNLILNLGKAFDITYVRIVFYSPRPESFAIYKRTHQNGDWEPYQYYSSSCRDTYGLPDSPSASKDAETQALCTSEYSDISPLKGGNVAFSTLEGRPSAYSFDSSPDLQEWVTATDIRITLDRLNTFGDEVFGDEQVLQSYWYAIADVAVGARCKCNGHASECVLDYGPNKKRQRRCVCEHHTAGLDCEKCADFYNDAPWGRASQYRVNECKPCNCNGYSKECIFDKELFERTGHGGHCLNCSGNRDGPNCERCKENFYQRRDNLCVFCDCNPTGSRSLQCNSEGKCQCKPGVTGEKCDQCAPNHFQFTNQGCKQCLCNEAGSVGNIPNCDPNTGICNCKENVEGKRCGDCKPGFFNADKENKFGCTPCFCYGHSAECRSAPGYSKILLESNFVRNNEKWTAQDAQRKTIGLKYNGKLRNIAVGSPSNEYVYFNAPENYLGDQRASYNHDMKFTFHINESTAYPSSTDIILEGSGIYASIRINGQFNPNPSKEMYEYVFRLHEHPEYEWSPKLTTRSFMSILSNLTAIRIRGTYSNMGVGILENFKLETAYRRAAGPPAHWIEMCSCPPGYVGQFCESCAPGYRHSPALGGPFKPCISCNCNKHASICDSETGRCICDHNTIGYNCERCAKGYYGNATSGTPYDCKECPCPNKGACIQMGDDVVCIECPNGYGGNRCEVCSDGYFGDPNGEFGPPTPCKTCECNHNIDTNAVANCNRTTGECLKCIHYTSGANCEQCLPGYYGDALAPTKGDCRQCECYRLGTIEDQMGISQCNRLNGQCECKENVQGRNCDKCRDGYYNIKSGEGCQLCNCNIEGSFNNTCDLSTGQCYCRPGITGMQCDLCKPNHYGFSNKGCQECLCDIIGSKGLQCDVNGQCPCYDNVEGLHCDMCKENKHDRQMGCIDCHPCYNLVQDAVNIHREKLNKLEKMLSDIEKSPTVIPDSDFDHNLAQVKEQINSLLKKANEIADTGDSGKTLIQKLEDFNKRLELIDDQLKNINKSIENAQLHAQDGAVIIKNADDIIEASRKEIYNAMEYLQVDGAKALAKAQNRSDQFGQQSTQMSLIAQESRLITEKLEKEANNIKDIAQTAFNKSFESYQLAKDGLGQQSNISNELRSLRNNIDSASDKLKDVQIKAADSQNRSRNAKDEALDILAQVKNLVTPSIDVAQIKADAEEMMFQAKDLQEKILKLKDDNEDILTTLKTQNDYSEKLLNRSSIQQETLDDIVATLDVIRSNASKAIESVQEKYKEAKVINETLKQFHNKVKTSQKEAEDAFKLVPEINLILDNITMVRENLEKAEKNAHDAEDLALKAKATATKAMEEAKSAHHGYNNIINSAHLLLTEAEQLPGRVKESENSIEEIERKLKEHGQMTSDTKIKVGQVKIDVTEADKAVMKGLNEVNTIMSDLSNLPNLNENDLDSLERHLREAEMELKRANLTDRIQKLQDAKNKQQRWLKDYEDEVKKLAEEVENVKNISESMPDGCFKRLTLEP